jgi:AraC-like DNA-binding protein
MVYLEQPPSPILRAWIRSLWYCSAPDVPHTRERVLPYGRIQIVLNLARDYMSDCGEDGSASTRVSRALVQGVRLRYEVIDTADLKELVGIVFQPGGFPGLFHERADLLFDQGIPLEDLCRSAALMEQLSDASTPSGKLQVLDQFLKGLAHQPATPSCLPQRALAFFQTGQLNVGACAEAVGVSTRRLTHVFREEIGVTPKAWCRLHRFQRALKALYKGENVPWAALALDCGYYDQSHFANEFRAFSGIDPTTYSSSRGPWRNHVVIR